MKVIDKTGNKYGLLTVIGLSRREFRSSRHGYTNYWKCKCDCGGETEVYQGNLVTGMTKSCGCLSSRKTFAKRVTTHGMSYTSTYKIWSGMKDRCYKPTHNQYHLYGGSGIDICERWRESFENFFEDMGPRPSGHSIERLDNKKGYSPSNCVWATAEQQANNTRANRVIKCGDEVMTLARWARKTGIGARTIARRLDRGWSVERALGEKP